MTIRRLFQDWRTAVVVAVLLISASFGFGGTTGGIGMILGLVGSLVSALGLVGVCWLLAQSAAENPTPKSASALIVLAFLLKLPLYVAFSNIARNMGMNAPNCFLWGLGLVYFGLVGWAVAKS